MSRTLRVLVAWVGLLWVALPVAAQTPASGVSREELQAVTSELARLRAEVAALRGEVSALRHAGAPVVAVPAVLRAGYTPPPAPLPVQPEQPDPAVEMLRTQVAELAQTRIESRSRMPVRLFGAVVSNTVSNSGAANWLENPNIVEAPLPGSTPGSFTSTLRQSQVGLNIGPIPVGG
jgi:hypothetical protein